MSWKIIEQSNGKFCIFSTVVDNVIAYDMTRDEVVAEFSKESGIRSGKAAAKIIDKISLGDNPYNHYPVNYEEMLTHIKNIHGYGVMDEVKTAIEQNDKP